MEFFVVFAALLVCLTPTGIAFRVVEGGYDDEHRPISDEVHEYHPGGQYQSYGGYVSDWNKDWTLLPGTFGGRGVSQAKCVEIPDNLTLCRNIGYRQMRLPNLLEHDLVKEATQQAASWVPLLNIRCHPDTQVFLCSLFAPVCLDRPIWPCRTLCEAVKSGCENLMLKYGFPWPEMLRCDKFPMDNDLCIGVRNDNKPDDTQCNACVQPETFEGIIDNFCSAEFVMRIKLEKTTVTGSDLRISSAKKKKMFKKGTLRSKELRDTEFYVENGAKCSCTKLGSSAAPKSSNYLVMGHRRNERMILSFVQPFDSQVPAMSKALVAMRKKICKAGIEAISPVERNQPDVTVRKKNDEPVAKKKEEVVPKEKETNQKSVKKSGKANPGKPLDGGANVKVVRSARRRKPKDQQPTPSS